MPHLTPCLGLDDEPCGEPTEGSRCKEHQRLHEARRSREEPWRRIYSDPLYVRAVPLVLDRDDHRCTFVLRGVRCQSSGPLQVHHEVKLRELWKQCSGDYALFRRRATDKRFLRSLCETHHRFVDNNDPREARTTNGVVRKRVRSQARRNERHGKQSSQRIARGKADPLDLNGRV